MTCSQKGDYKQSNLWCLVQTMFNTYCALLNCYLALSFVALPIELLMLFAAVTDQLTSRTSTTSWIDCFSLATFKITRLPGVLWYVHYIWDTYPFVALPIELLMLFAAVTDRSTSGTSTTFRLYCFRLTSLKSACRHIVIRFT